MKQQALNLYNFYKQNIVASLLIVSLLFGLLLNGVSPTTAAAVVTPTFVTPTATYTLTWTPLPHITETPTSTTTPISTATPLGGGSLNLYFSLLPAPYMRYATEYSGVSQTGLAFVASKEGYFGQKYNDGEPISSSLFYDQSGAATGNCTIGYGHLLHIGPCNGGEGYRGGISQAAALVLLHQELDHCGTYVAKYVTVRITQTQYDVLSGLVCGWGYGPFSKSKVLGYLNQGLYVEAAEALKTTAIYGIGGYGPYPGLVKRRVQEAVMFLETPIAP